MSYCRWSSDDFKCDLYIYEDTSGGFTTHVAGRKHTGDIPTVPTFGTVTMQEWTEANQKQSDWLVKADYKEIDLPYAGETFNDETLEDLLLRVENLISLGYRVPKYVIQTIKEEIIDNIHNQK